jgi:hypothetical protein
MRGECDPGQNSGYGTIEIKHDILKCYKKRSVNENLLDLNI